MTIKAVALDFIRGVESVGPAEMEALGKEIVAKVGRAASRRYLLDLLLATDVEVERSVGGFPLDLRGRVHTRDEESAASSLIELSAEYSRARELGDKVRAEDCRRAVRHAKERLVLTLRRKGLGEEKRKEKAELREWFVVWLETPELFPDWIGLRLGSLEPRA